MIHYHGLPIGSCTVAEKAVGTGHAFVSFLSKGQLGLVVHVCQSFAVDNGAFSMWKRGATVDWLEYYEWVAEISRYPNFDFAVIPDKIDGTEEENDALITEWPLGNKGSPVWHMHESITRLEKLCKNWRTVCLGSSGVYSEVGTPQWWERMSEIMDSCCDSEGYPKAKLHGLRMLNPKIFSKLPLSSADSTSIGRNVGMDDKWKKGRYSPPTKEARAAIMRERIEIYQGGLTWERGKELL